MVYHKVITSALLLGAGAGLAVARPHNSHTSSRCSHTSSSASHHTGSASLSTGSASLSNGRVSSSSSQLNSSESGIAAISADSGCTFTDAATAKSKKASCTNIVLKDIAIPGGETLDMTGLTKGTTVQFQGNTSVGYKEWAGPVISFSGISINITGAEGHVIDGNGAQWWDGKGSNGGKTKPKFFYAHNLNDSTIQGLNIKNHPVQCFSVDNTYSLSIKDVTVDNSAADAKGSDGNPIGHNTDAFDVGSSSSLYISGVKVKNQDDCLAINSGTDISFTDSTCSGGHGLSIGSVGGRGDNAVKNVKIANSQVTNSDNGVRIKTVSGATGSVSNVTYSGITLSNIAKYGIVIEQDYQNGSPTGDPTDGVPITDLTISSVTGSVASGAERVYILCASCSDWTWTDVSITGGKQSSKCQGNPTGVSC